MSDLLPIATPRQTWGVLRAEIVAHRATAAFALLTVTAASAAGLIAPWVLGDLVDAIAGGQGTGAVVRSVLVIAVAAVVGGALTGLGTALVARLGETMLARLRERVMDHALRLSSATVERVGVGDLLSRVGDDVSAVTKAINTTGPDLVRALITVALTAAGLFALDWRLGVAGLVAGPFYVLALRWFLPRSSPFYAKERVAVADRTQALMGSLRGGATVRAHRLEDTRTELITERSAAAMTLSLTVFRLFTRLASRMNRAECIGLSAVLVVGFLLVRDDIVTVGAVTAAALYFHRLFNPVGMLLMLFDDAQQAAACLARLAGVVLSRPPEPPASPGVPADASVEVEAVGHRYDGPPVLADVSLRIEPGERVALVGASGAGKTTLAGIVAGLLRPTDGRVRVGGVPIEDIGEDRVRSTIALISQEVHVFAGPLLDDVRLARAGATDEEVLAALERVDALDWVRALPDGPATPVGEGGHALTAAQAQHLALARLVLADPPIAILDEATADAGSAGARTLERAAAAATAGRTTLVIAHRLTQAVTADRVVVLDHGRVVESGTHDELLAAGGRYRDLWRSWTGDVERAG